MIKVILSKWGSLLSKLRVAKKKIIYGSAFEVGPRVFLRKGVEFRPLFGSDSLRIRLSGDNRIGSWSIFQGSGSLVIGKRTFCGDFCVFGVNDSLIIGDDVMIAPAVTIRDTDHSIDRTDIPMNKQGIKTSPVIIENDVWIGHGATILKGVKIGTGSVVSAGAVVTRNVAPYSIVGGIPAKLIKQRPQAEVDKGENHEDA